MNCEYVIIHQYPEPRMSYDFTIMAQIMIGFMLISLARTLFWPAIQEYIDRFDDRTKLEKC